MTIQDIGFFSLLSDRSQAWQPFPFLHQLTAFGALGLDPKDKVSPETGSETVELRK
jgi:hypothetical protein